MRKAANPYIRFFGGFSAGLAQYSGDPKTEWHLNAHPTKESLLNAIANLPYKGGNTMTGDVTALCPVQTGFKPVTVWNMERVNVWKANEEGP